ncbi:TPA: hypothetical protein DD449_02935 [Candidatus Berkelbacteria bacterium]|uniref:Uncharacterized protein n=1 Tax=Berkelbacteria bacterium GW2011_GWE1_39_12 TaxID=1618337 RepID=A0A0G4B2B6_9BACT|nr:MAG: hypothetical protein UT28_C0001G0183 [Berkelbacteria bacterium GW2011_GWE1_39_12]HBO60613.1 hypothetical protein [Candidatus Berkelbacteria bacterium]
MKRLHILLAIALLISVVWVVGCGGGDPRTGSKSSNNSGSVIDYENGVYYFDSIEANFANSLSGFIKDHPDLELVSMAGDDMGIHGASKGYFVVFRKKQ